MNIRTRRNKKHLWKVALLGLAALFIFAACSGSAGQAGPAGPQGPAGPSAADSQAGYDMTLLAEGGTAQRIGGNRYDIMLTGVHPNVLAFQSRPNRGLAHFEVESMVGLWQQMFGDGNGSPNVSMTSRDLNGNSDDPIAFSMAGPSIDESNGAMTFEMTTLPGSPAPIENFTDVSLFIDPTAGQWLDIGWFCGSAIVSILGGIALAVLSEGTAASIGELLIAYGVDASADCIGAIVDADW